MQVNRNSFTCLLATLAIAVHHAGCQFGDTVITNTVQATPNGSQVSVAHHSVTTSCDVDAREFMSVVQVNGSALTLSCYDRSALRRHQARIIRIGVLLPFEENAEVPRR